MFHFVAVATREPLIGEVPGVAPGTRFDTRQEAHQAEVHRELQAGICGRAETGAESVVLAGGYVDDRDEERRIVYTGAGGRDPETKRQIADQSFALETRASRWNRALAVSCDSGLPVRVLRGHQSRHGPASGYRYDGLWRVVRYWMGPGEDGHRVCLFEMVPFEDEVRLEEPVGMAEPDQDLFVGEGEGPVDRRPETFDRIVRDPRLVLRIKELYDYACQFCGTQVATSAGPYAEAAHVRPLGRPHDGPDAVANMLCLCPNCHSAFDRGGLTVGEDGTVEGVDGRTMQLRVKAKHGLETANLAYHREMWRRT